MGPRNRGGDSFVALSPGPFKGAGPSTHTGRQFLFTARQAARLKASSTDSESIRSRPSAPVLCAPTWAARSVAEGLTGLEHGRAAVRKAREEGHRHQDALQRHG